MSTAKARVYKRKLYQRCYKIVVAAFAQHALNGIKMVGPNGEVYRGHPVLASFVCDYPEGVLVTNVKSGCCTRCEVVPFALDNFDDGCGRLRQTGRMVTLWGQHKNNPNPILYEELDSGNFSDNEDDFDLHAPILSRREANEGFKSLNVWPVHCSFWDWSFVNIYTLIGLDPLHELLKGIFGTHLLKWLFAYFKDHGGAEEFDKR